MELFNLFGYTNPPLNTGAHDPVFIAAISALSGVAIAYITNVAAKRVQANKASKQPKDRMEQMFDGYERLIKQKDAEDDRKQRYIKVIEGELDATKLHVSKLEEAMERTNQELAESREDNKKLQANLDEMRREYKTVKHSQ